MTTDRMPSLASLRKGETPAEEWLRSQVERLVREVMEAEVRE